MVKIEYLLGHENSAADTLSRQDWEEEEDVDETEPYRPPSGGGGCGGPAPPGGEERSCTGGDEHLELSELQNT